jgi:hypothetical protein
MTLRMATKAPSTRAPVVIFAVAALSIALTAGFGLGLWLLLARTLGLSTLGMAWPALVQAHGTIQLVGFAALFLMGVGLHVLPRFRGAERVAPAVLALAFAPTVAGVALRAIAQPWPTFPQRDAALAASGLLLVLGNVTFAVAGLRTLARGSNPHRPDELVMAAGVLVAPLGALLLVAATPPASAPLVLDQSAIDRATWMMLLGSLATAIVGVWARLAGGFIASPPPRRIPLLAGSALWLFGVLALVADVPLAGGALLGGFAVVVWAIRVFGPPIARQPLAGHARLTRLAVRTAFIWGIAGAMLLAWFQLRAALGNAPGYLEVSAARHAFGLGFVTLMIYGVGARALPSFIGRRLWSERLQLATIVLANGGVALRVLPEVIAGAAWLGVIALSGVLAYAALVLFAVNVVRTLRSAAMPPARPGAPVPITLRAPAAPRRAR